MPDRQGLRTVIEAEIHRRSLSGLTVDAARRVYSCAGNGPAPDLSFLDCRNGIRESIATEIERQLNSPFDLSGPFCPFRFFVAPGDGSFHLGIAYLHAVADGESIVLLMKAVVEEYTGKGEAAGEHSSRRALQTLRELRPGPGVVLRKIAALRSQISNLRRSCRPAFQDPSDLAIGFALFSAGPEKLRGLVQAAKSWGITVNDVLLALLMKSCTPLATGRATDRRDRISLGCIVNIRKDLPREAIQSFGLHLGSFLITQKLAPDQPLKVLATDINRETTRIKKERLYLATSLELSLGRFLLAFFSTGRQKKLYQKHYPLWGGLTNMNINSLWPSAFGCEPPDYIRAVSTGPVTPLVLSFTTSGPGANIGISFRTTVFSPSDIERIKACLLDSLTDLEAA